MLWVTILFSKATCDIKLLVTRKKRFLSVDLMLLWSWSPVCSDARRKNGVNKLIRILRQDGYYGFSKPLLYRSVPDLIEYYQEHSLAHYNPRLDTKLQFALSRFYAQQNGTGSKRESDSLVEKLKGINNDFDNHNGRYHDLYKEHSTVCQVSWNLFLHISIYMPFIFTPLPSVPCPLSPSYPAVDSCVQRSIGRLDCVILTFSRLQTRPRTTYAVCTKPWLFACDVNVCERELMAGDTFNGNGNL